MVHLVNACDYMRLCVVARGGTSSDSNHQTRSARAPQGAATKVLQQFLFTGKLTVQ